MSRTDIIKDIWPQLLFYFTIICSNINQRFSCCFCRKLACFNMWQKKKNRNGIKIWPTTKHNLHQNRVPNLLQMTTRGRVLTNNNNKIQSNEEDYKRAQKWVKDTQLQTKRLLREARSRAISNARLMTFLLNSHSV